MPAKTQPKKQIPPVLRDSLRMRFGVKEDDPSKDDLIAELSPAEMVREAVAWELGDPGWANLVASYMRAAGAKPEDFIL